MPRFLFWFLMAMATGTAFAQERPIEVSTPVEISGMLKPFREVRLASRSQGVIQKILEEGTEVKQGEAVVVLEDAMEKLQVQQQLQVVAMREFESKASEKLGNQAAISRQEAMEKNINFEIAKIQLSQAQENLDRRKVAAPFSGVITERLREVGEAVDEFVPVLTMVDLEKLYFEAYLPADQIRQVHEGQRVEIRIPTHPEKVFNGVVRLKSPVVNAASTEFKIKVEIDNSQRVLSSGVAGTCRLLPMGSDSGAAPEAPKIN